MSRKKLFFLIAGILIFVTIVTIFTTFKILDIREKNQEKPFEIHQKVCFMPRDCFDTEQEFKEQFPEGKVPEFYPECLIYCTKNINYELYPIK